jgi:hypothetical protein
MTCLTSSDDPCQAHNPSFLNPLTKGELAPLN